MLKNFSVIKRYNNADKYALAVGLLADEIAGSSGLVQDWNRPFTKLTFEEKQELQQRLSEHGYYDGKFDGKIGDGSRSAIKAFQARVGLAAGWSSEQGSAFVAAQALGSDRHTSLKADSGTIQRSVRRVCAVILDGLTLRACRAGPCRRRPGLRPGAGASPGRCATCCSSRASRRASTANAGTDSQGAQEAGEAAQDRRRAACRRPLCCVVEKLAGRQDRARHRRFRRRRHRRGTECRLRLQSTRADRRPLERLLRLCPHRLLRLDRGGIDEDDRTEGSRRPSSSSSAPMTGSR